MCNNFKLCVVAALAAFSELGYSQPSQNSPESPPPESFVQFMNATSVPLVDLAIEGGRKYSSLKQGARISGGIYPQTEFSITAVPSNNPPDVQQIRANLDLKSDKASTVVLLGDWQPLEKDQVLEQQSEPKIRAKILQISHSIPAGLQPNRLTIVNGLAEQPLEVLIPDKDPIWIPAMEQASVDSLPRAFLFKATTKEKVFEIPLEFNPTKSISIAFFQKDSDPDFTVMTMPTIEEFKHE